MMKPNLAGRHYADSEFSLMRRRRHISQRCERSYFSERCQTAGCIVASAYREPRDGLCIFEPLRNVLGPSQNLVPIQPDIQFGSGIRSRGNFPHGACCHLDAFLPLAWRVRELSRQPRHQDRAPAAVLAFND